MHLKTLNEYLPTTTKVEAAKEAFIKGLCSCPLQDVQGLPKADIGCRPNPLYKKHVAICEVLDG